MQSSFSGGRTTYDFSLVWNKVVSLQICKIVLTSVNVQDLRALPEVIIPLSLVPAGCYVLAHELLGKREREGG